MFLLFSETQETMTFFTALFVDFWFLKRVPERMNSSMTKSFNFLLRIILLLLFLLEILQKFCPTMSLNIVPRKLNRWANVKFWPRDISLRTVLPSQCLDKVFPFL